MLPPPSETSKLIFTWADSVKIEFSAGEVMMTERTRGLPPLPQAVKKES